MQTRPVVVGLLVVLAVMALLLLVLLSLIACSQAPTQQTTELSKVDPSKLALKIDPYCGMSVEKHPIAATHAHNGKTYGFCSDFCKDEFAKDPEKHLANPGKGSM